MSEWAYRWARVMLALAVLGVVAILLKQGVAIARHGVDGWLAGEGSFQTEWEVRAALGLLIVGVPALVIIAAVRAGEGVPERVLEWRLSRALRRRRNRR